MLSDLMEHLSKVGKRQPSFLIMLEHIMKRKDPLIFETGTMRTPDNYEGDGMSTLLWHNVLRLIGKGNLVTIDIDREASEFALRLCGQDLYQYNAAQFITEDSVKYMSRDHLVGRPIDLLYLDSWDMEFPDPTPSFKHTFTEFMLARPHLAYDALICVDDNIRVVRDNNPDEISVSKGEYIKEYMHSIGNEPIYEGYQIIWRNNRNFF